MKCIQKIKILKSMKVMHVSFACITTASASQFYCSLLIKDYITKETCMQYIYPPINWTPNQQ